MSPVEIEIELARIAKMTHFELAAAWRNLPIGHPIFTTPELATAFRERFSALGGMTPQISKAVGWDSAAD